MREPGGRQEQSHFVQHHWLAVKAGGGEGSGGGGAGGMGGEESGILVGGGSGAALIRLSSPTQRHPYQCRPETHLRSGYDLASRFVRGSQCWARTSDWEVSTLPGDYQRDLPRCSGFR